jgi:hypothetical protein
MPWTFAHPAAVLPIKRFCPASLDFSALVIGSMIPDLGYYLPHSTLARPAHSFLGSVLICLPAGIALWGIFRLLRKPLCFVLPQPHRRALAPLAATPLRWRPRILIAAGVSVLLGAWTHIVWDSFTHNGSWVVNRLPLLRDSAFQVSTVEFPWYFFLQQVSTLLGVTILIVSYCSWLRLHCGSVKSSPIGADDRWRYLLLFAVAALALAIAVPRAAQKAARFEGSLALRVLAIRIAVDTTATFIPLLTLSSLVLYARRRESHAAR